MTSTLSLLTECVCCASPYIMKLITAVLLCAIITIANAYEPVPRRRSQYPYAPPLHLFPGPSAPFRNPSSPSRHPTGSSRIPTGLTRKPSGRLSTSRGPPPFRPIPTYPQQSSKPLSRPYPKYPPSQSQRPYGGYKKVKGPTTHAPFKKYNPYPHGNMVTRPTPYPQPHYTEDPPRETIATFVDKPKNNQQVNRYKYNKNPSVSYGPPYPPKPFKAYGVYEVEEENAESQISPVTYKVTEDGSSDGLSQFPEDPIYSSVQKAATVNYPELTQVKRRRPQQHQEKFTQIRADQTRQNDGFGEFLQETFTERTRQVRRPSNHQYEEAASSQAKAAQQHKQNYSWQ